MSSKESSKRIRRRAYLKMRILQTTDKNCTYTDFEVVCCIVNCARFGNHRKPKALLEDIHQRLPNLGPIQFARCTKLCTDNMRD